MFGTSSFGWQSGGSGGGGGTIGGSITSPEVAYGSGANTITGDPTFTFDSSAKKQVAMNKILLHVSSVITPNSPDGTLEYDGNILWFTIGTTRYQVALT